MICLTVLSSDPRREKVWTASLKKLLKPWKDIEVHGGTELKFAHGPLVLVDARDEKIWKSIDRRGRAVVLICGQKDRIPEALLEQEVDDVLVAPFRQAEVFGKIRHYQQLLMWNEVAQINQDLSGLVEAFHEDVSLAERLQKSRLPRRFDSIKGFSVASRYLAGERSGGDYFDLADSADGQQLSIVLSDSSSYGLSSSVLSTLMGALVRLSADQSRSCRAIVRAIYNEVLATLKETDRLSLFYGIVNRKDYKLRYLSFGHTRAFLAQPGRSFEAMPVQGNPLGRGAGLGTAEEVEFKLEPGSRLILLSDGFVDAAGGEQGALQLLEKFREKEALDLLNELVFSVKNGMNRETEMPPQDCTALIFHTDPKILRLAG